MDDSFKLSLSQKDVVVGDDLKNANICPFLTPLYRSFEDGEEATSKNDAYVVSVYMADRLPFVTRYSMKTTPLHRHIFFLSFFFGKERGLCYRNRNEQVSSHQRGKNCEEPFRFCCSALFHTDNRGSTSSYVFAEIKVKKKRRERNEKSLEV